MFENDLDWLDHFLSKGYVLHGSPRRVCHLLPKQAHDTKRQAGCQYGIYATRNLLVAIAASLLRSTGLGMYYTTWEGNDDHLRVTGHNATFGDRGFIYILHPSYFEQLTEDTGSSSCDFLARKVVEPLGVVPITREILPQVPISYEFNPPLATLIR